MTDEPRRRSLPPAPHPLPAERRARRAALAPELKEALERLRFALDRDAIALLAQESARSVCLVATRFAACQQGAKRLALSRREPDVREEFAAQAVETRAQGMNVDAGLIAEDPLNEASETSQERRSAPRRSQPLSTAPTSAAPASRAPASVEKLRFASRALVSR